MYDSSESWSNPEVLGLLERITRTRGNEVASPEWAQFVLLAPFISDLCLQTKIIDVDRVYLGLI